MKRNAPPLSEIDSMLNELTVVRCKVCGETIDATEFPAHARREHPAELQKALVEKAKAVDFDFQCSPEALERAFKKREL